MLGYNVTASDLSESELKEAEKRSQKNDQNIKFIQANFCDLSMKIVWPNIHSIDFDTIEPKFYIYSNENNERRNAFICYLKTNEAYNWISKTKNNF